MHLTGGVGEATFQPPGFSRPNSDCEGTPFTPTANDQSRITYIDYRRHLQKKAQWSTHEIQSAVVTYQLSVKVMKKIGYIMNGGKRLVIPDMLTINRTTNETSEDSTSGRKTISNMGLDIINQDLEGYKDAALSTIVFNKTKIPKTNCEEYRSVAEITDGSLYKSKLGEFSIFRYIRDGESIAVTIDQQTRSCGREFYRCYT